MKKENQNITRKQRIEEILRTAAERQDISKEMSAILDAWILEIEQSGDYEQATASLFDSDMIEKNKPSKACLKALAEANRRIGYAPAKKMPLYRKTLFRVASAAAVVLIVLGVSLTTLLKNETPLTLAEITVEAIDGVQKEIVLADNSTVWMNSSSKITYSEEFGEERNIKLEGQARFEVKKDAERPFRVQTERLQVKVLGTDFHVKEYPAEDYTEVLLYSGSVEVNAKERTIILVPGERLTYHHRTGEINIETVEIDAMEDWRSDRVFVDNKTIPEILDMIANYYDTEIVFDPVDFSDPQLYIFGFGKDESVEGVMDAIVKISGNSFRYELNEQENTIYVTK